MIDVMMFERNVYGSAVCPVCGSTNVLIPVYGEYDHNVKLTDSNLRCIDCHKKKTGQQGVIAWRIRDAAQPLDPMMVNFKRGEFRVRWPFGWLLKWLRVRFVWNKKIVRKSKMFEMVYTEQFIPREFIKT